MQKLLAFLISKRHWILFLLFETISFVLIYRNNAYQRNMMLSSANTITGGISLAANTVFSYLDLQHVNRQLLERNSLLEMEVLRLQEQLKMMSLDTVRPAPDYTYEYISAGIANSTTNYVNNYITINKGFKDGIRPDMGVVSPLGIVGIVMTVNEHYSVVISLLNTKSKVSCKVKNTSFFGPLSWNGDDVKYAYLEELPTHATFQVGDTIVTSGNSAIFPPDLIVGIVESYGKQRDDNFYSLKVRLATDFQSLNIVYVIVNHLQEEQWKIEREAVRND
ncbi:MAG: rod shape-determining protein MreC [Tannerella sp.]|jgi:rod shape-determining protein MreC|nr:rod shape-determining protein MreC [Tannerella sp.]